MWSASRCGRRGSPSPPRSCCPSTIGPGCAATGRWCAPRTSRSPTSIWCSLAWASSAWRRSPASSWRCCSISASGPRTSCARFSSIRSPCRSSSPARCGAGCSIPASESRSSCATLGWTDFRFDWIIDRDMAIYTIVIAAAWHAAGFAMALFLAGLRSIDPDLAKAAQIDGAGPLRYYLRIVLPRSRRSPSPSSSSCCSSPSRRSIWCGR